MLIHENDPVKEVLRKVMQHIRAAASDSSHPFRFAILGTKGPEFPAVRYIVVRDFTAQMELVLFSDLRANKTNDITRDASVSLLMYHPDERVQVRIQGKARVHRQDEVSSKYWHEVPAESRKAYASRVAPGSPVNSPADAHQWPENIDDRYFAVISVQMTSLDILQLQGMSHLRARFTRNGPDWAGEWIAP